MTDENILKKDDKILRIRRNIRDSVFHSLIRRPKYLREIYLSLYPDDKDIREDEIRLIDSNPVFIGGAVHDACFTVRDSKVIFIEVQSTLCRLLSERMLIYYSNNIPRVNGCYC